MIEYKILLSKEDKEYYKNSIFDLFKNVYERDLSKSIWQHQFINSPYKNSPLFIGLDDNKIIGMGLMIAQKAKIDNHIYNYYLFTTSAIKKTYRTKGVYAELLMMQKKYANENQIDFIFAFPNKLAYPVLKLFGGFRDVKKIDLVRTKLSNIDFTKNNNSLVIDKNMKKWRFEHKEYRFATKKNNIIIYKEFNGCYDILAIYKKEDICEVNFDDFNQSYDVIVVTDNVINNDKAEKIDVLYATYFPINKNIRYNNLNINLLMSDVF